MFRYMSPIALFLWATTSTAAIQNSEFWFHDDGDTIFIDGKRGAPLHIDYIGAPLTKPLTVRVTPNNPKLKIAAPICTFTKKDDDCRLTVHNAKEGDNVYGVNHFTVTEAGGSRGVLNAQAASETSTVGFWVGVQGKDMPKPIPWKAIKLVWTRINGTVIIANRTSQRRDYQSPFRSLSLDKISIFAPKSPIYSLDPGRICYLDQSIGRGYANYDNDADYPTSGNRFFETSFTYVSDMTNPQDPIYNGPFTTGNNNITTCSANGTSDCASNKWASWTVALANLSGKDLDSDVFKAGQIQVLQNNTWGNGTTLYFTDDWSDFNVGLILIQGSTDGSDFDPNAAAPSIIEIKSAPPCSNYIKGDPSVTYKVIADVYGPGSVTMLGGEKCVIVKVPNSEFTRCTGSGIKDRIYEITAVPEAGKTFKGWNSKGLCDDAKTTCRFQLTSEVSIQPLFW